MNKLFTFAVLATAVSITFPAHSAVEVPAVVVSAARTEQSTLTTPASITVITRQQIDASGSNHLIEVLRGQAGVQVRDLYGDGNRASIDMRGFGDSSSSNTLVLIDGRRLNNTDAGLLDLNSVALDDVERIEIVQGSAGVLFGDQAVGGVVNIITSKPGGLRHSLKLAAGSYDRVNLHAMTSQTMDNGVNYRVSLDLRESDNYREHNESSYLNGFGKLGYDYSSGSVFVEMQYIDDELEAPGALFSDEVAADRKQINPSFATDFSNSETLVARIGLVQELSSNWSFEGEATNRETDGVFKFSSSGSAPSTENSTQNREIQEFTPRFIGVIPALNNTMLTIGADAVESDYKLSSPIGDQFNEQSQRSIYLQAVVPINNVVDVTAGVRHARVENDLRDSSSKSWYIPTYPAGVQINDDITVGTLGFALKANDNLRFLLRADQNYRFAKVEEFLQPAFTPAITPVELKTQEGLSLETGIEWSQGSNTAKVIIYNLNLENEITFDPTVGAYGANINLDNTERTGLITSGYWKVTQDIGLSVSYTFTDAEVVSGSFAGNDIPLVAEHSASISVDYALAKSWQLFTEIIVVSDRVTGGDFDNSHDRLPGYGLANVKAEYTVKDFTFSGRVNNILNKEYSDIGQLGYNPNPPYERIEAFYPSPEINFLLTAAWDFR